MSNRPIIGVTVGTPINPDKMGGTSDYTKLENKPKINGVELDGDKTLEALGIPTGGGSDWVLAKEFILTEDVLSATIILDKPISGEILIHINVVAAESNSGNGAFRIFFNNSVGNELYHCDNGIYKGVKVYNFLYRNYKEGFFSPVFYGSRYGDTVFKVIERGNFDANLNINTITIHAGTNGVIFGSGTEVCIYCKEGNQS